MSKLIALWKKYGVHALAALLSVLTFFADLPAPIVKLLGAHASAIVALATFLLTLYHTIATALTAPPPTVATIAAQTVTATGGATQKISPPTKT